MFIMVFSRYRNGGRYSTWGESGESDLPSLPFRYWHQFQVPTSLESRFFVDDGVWRKAKRLTGHTSFYHSQMSETYLWQAAKGSCSFPKSSIAVVADRSSGSWLVRHLTVKYPDHYNVVSFDKQDYCSSLNNARMLESRANFKVFHGDVIQPNDVFRCLKKHN
jgi:hypothetical protein